MKKLILKTFVAFILFSIAVMIPVISESIILCLIAVILGVFSGAILRDCHYEDVL